MDLVEEAPLVGVLDRVIEGACDEVPERDNDIGIDIEGLAVIVGNMDNDGQLLLLGLWVGVQEGVVDKYGQKPEV